VKLNEHMSISLLLPNESVEKLCQTIFALFPGVFLPLLIARSSIVVYSPRSFFYAFSIKRRLLTYSTGSTKKSTGAAQRAAIGCSDGLSLFSLDKISGNVLMNDAGYQGLVRNTLLHCDDLYLIQIF
jgi:hypothetical protein